MTDCPGTYDFDGYYGVDCELEAGHDGPHAFFWQDPPPRPPIHQTPTQALLGLITGQSIGTPITATPWTEPAGE